MGRDLQLLIIGAGPFGLALAAQAVRDGIDHEIVGRPMDFWKSNMPAGTASPACMRPSPVYASGLL